MATLAAAFSVFTFLIFMTNAKGDPLMEVHPSEIRFGISSSLDINCSFSSTDHPEMADFASLILSKANLSGEEFEDMAAITQFTPDSVTVLTEEKISATGVHNHTGESFLHVTWQYPTKLQSGVYKCTAYGLDILGECLEVVNTYVVTVDEADLNDVFEKLRQMEIHGMAMENKMSDMEAAMLSMEKHIQALEYNNSQMSSDMSDLNNTVDPLRPLMRLNLLGTYRNHDYYISKDAYGEINNAMDVCRSYGGHLVEIDNGSEYNAVKEFLSHTYGITYAMIAGTDEASDGTWVLQSTNKALPYNTLSGGSGTGTDENCLSLYGSSWTMDDYVCNRDPPRDYDRFLCEIPRV